MKVFYFSGTGNSLYVAKKFSTEMYSIPQLMKEGRLEFEDESIGFVFPCYSFGLPRMVLDFLKKSKLKASYYFGVMTYGNMAGSGLSHLEEISGQVGIKFNYTAEILMADNYLPMFKMEDQSVKDSNADIEKNLEEIALDIAARKNKLTRKGLASVTFSKLVHLSYKGMLDEADKKFIVQESCNGCGICQKVCPKKNIVVKEKAKFQHRCDSCYACIHNCPRNAIHLKNERSKARYINENIVLKELIAANNQAADLGI
ncbi:MAG TPA: 4Fe-4S ferredoxin [Cyanobacteria bacterium UBA8530]|nr:4Fe-4S ferredoxin [Cyanobacteria bacterium UBA8530]